MAGAITGRTRVVGVWGHPVSHSRSPAMHNAALQALGLDWVYVPFDVDPDEVAAAVAAVRALGLVGVNVTVPLKERILPFLDSVDEEAARIGSVNTIHNRDGVLHGASTDGGGFLRSLEALGQPVAGRRVYVLGAGGSARAVVYALAAQGAQVTLANRTQARAEELAAMVNTYFKGKVSVAEWGAEAAPFDLLVNTTSLGMTPQADAIPAVPPNGWDSKPFVYDLIYAPPESRLLARARAAGCAVSNGLPMLVHQGALSLARWSGRPVAQMPLDTMVQAVLALE